MMRRAGQLLAISAARVVAHDWRGTDSAELRTYLKARLTELLATPSFLDVLPGMIFPDESLAERTRIVAERMRLLTQLE